jgi:hypothetical protein
MSMTGTSLQGINSALQPVAGRTYGKKVKRMTGEVRIMAFR